MRQLQILFTIFFCLGFNLLFGQSETTSISPEGLNGQWEIDLRPTPEASPYLKSFIVQFTDERQFSGSFYDTAFENGVINSAWGKVYFAFSTKDGKAVYFSSGYFDGKEIKGVTYCEKRNFVMPWAGVRK